MDSVSLFILLQKRRFYQRGIKRMTLNSDPRKASALGFARLET
jgi:hypothetical protein